MKSLWNDQEAGSFANDDLAMRVYSSRLLGQSEDLVLHGGGNTSVKSTQKNIFGEDIEVLYIKGSGWDLKTIEKVGFSPERLDDCIKLAALPELSDVEMVKQLRLALLVPSAPNGCPESYIFHHVAPYGCPVWRKI